MAKKKAAIVEKKSQKKVSAVLAVVFFLGCAACAFVFIAARWMPELQGVDKVLRGLGGDLRFALLPLLVYLGVACLFACQGRRMAAWKILVNLLMTLSLFAPLHLFFANYIDQNGYHVAASLGYGDFLKKSYDFGVGGGAIGALLGGFLFEKVGVGAGILLGILLTLGCLAVNGYLGRWIRTLRRRVEENRLRGEENRRRAVEQEADRNFEIDRRTMLRPEELVGAPPRRAHAPASAVILEEENPAAPRGTAARGAAARGTAARGAPARSASSGRDEAAPPKPAKRVSTAPRFYNETVKEGQAEAGAEAFGPVVRSGGAVPAARAGATRDEAKPFPQAKAGRIRKAAQEKEQPAQASVRLEDFAQDLTIEPDEYELPDEPPFDPTPPKKAKALGKLKKTEPVEEDPDGYNYPPIDLISHGKAPDKAQSDEADRERATLLCETLRSFGIETRLTGIAHGPAVTRFELQPAPGIKVSRITALSDDIALNLAAERVRIEAPIPGKAAVGVEVPNDEVETVALRDVLESAEARRHPSRLAVGLGKDNSGRYIVADIAKMPHVLIAGQTGSGKSVCINAIIISILYRATPQEVKLILIDPKVVELSIYNGIPHLIAPVVTDPKKAASALDWAVMEMTGRYKKFAERGVRDIKGYNKALQPGEEAMPQVVIIIDELADLMMVAPGEVEDSICRLAQLARAAGMHLVIATQRPSVNVITGIIKANIPTRIAFSVASQVDSRTMIDHGGAEKLLGNGDMLFVPSGINKPMRVQGAWVSDQEVHAVTEFIKQRHQSTYDEDVVEKINQSVMSDAEKEEAEQEYDPRLPEAVEIVVEAGQASISMLQRRMRVGYARAGRLIDEMALRGIVSDADGAKPRNVLITREQFRQMFDEDEDEGEEA